MLRGLRNYTDISTHHAPLLTEFLAVIYRLFGTDIMIRIILLILVSTLVALLTYRATNYLAGKGAALLSLLLLAILWPFYGGTNFWFDTFLPLFYMIAFVLIIESRTGKFIPLAGASMGLSFLTKQTAGAVALVIFIMLLLRPKDFRVRFKESVLFSIGVLIPIIAIALWYSFTGQLQDAYYWTIQYNLSPHYVILGGTRPPLNDIVRLLVISLPITLFIIFACFTTTARKLLSWNLLLALTIGFSASLTAFPRWERWHLIPSIPFLAVALAFTLRLLMNTRDSLKVTAIRKAITATIAIWILAVALDVGTYYPPLLIARIVPNFTRYWPLHSYAGPAWIDERYLRSMRDMPLIAAYLNRVTKQSDKIYVCGWEGSRLYWESKRLPAGKFYYSLPWFTCLPRFKKDLHRSFDQDPPSYVAVLKRRYPGTPSLITLGIDLKQRGYVELTDLQQRFPEVVIWRSPEIEQKLSR